MTAYRYIQLAFVASMVGLLAGCFVWYWPLWVLWMPVGVFVAITAVGSCFIRVSLHLKAICKGDRKSHKIAITFDDGPHPTITPAILAILKQHGATATFFCIGEQVELHRDITRQIVAEGHIVANHSWAHGFWFDLKSSHNMQVELNRTNHMLLEVTGLMPRYFRPPYGVTNPNLAKAVKATHMVPIGWSLRSMDTAITNPNWLLKRVKRRVKSGDIVLFHDTQTGTVSALKGFLEHCNAKGLAVVPLNELINIPAYD